jgi:hypothetical protein
MVAPRVKLRKEVNIPLRLSIIRSVTQCILVDGHQHFAGALLQSW